MHDTSRSPLFFGASVGQRTVPGKPSHSQTFFEGRGLLALGWWKGRLYKLLSSRATLWLVMQPVYFLRSTCIGRPVFGLMLCHHYFNIYGHGWIYILVFTGPCKLCSLSSLRILPLTSQFRWFFVGGWPVHCWVISSISGLYLLDTSSDTSLPLMTPNLSPGIAKCSLGGKVIPCYEPLG